MPDNLMDKVKSRLGLLDEIIESQRLVVDEHVRKEQSARIELGRSRSEQFALIKFVNHSNEIKEMLGNLPAGIASSPDDVPPPSSVGDGEPVAIEVNHTPASEEASKECTSSESLTAPKTAAEKIVVSLTENPDQTIDELVSKFSVTKAYVSQICAKNQLKFKKAAKGRPPTASAVVAKVLSKEPDKGNRTIAKEVGCSPKLVRDVRKKTGNARAAKPAKRSKSVASTSLTTRPSSIVQQRYQPAVAPSRKKGRMLFRIVERETGKYLHQDLLGMKKGPVFVEGVAFAWQGAESQLIGCASLQGFNHERLMQNDATYGYFAQKFEA